MTTIPLLATVRGTIAANGSAVLNIGPVVYGERWHVTYASINSDSALSTHADVYKDTVSPTTYVESSARGNGDTSDTVHDLDAPSTLAVRWTGGTPGANVWVTVRGTKDTGR